MKIILAPDKFKGSLTGLEFCDDVEGVLRSQLPHAEILRVPLADGGDGTIEVVNHYLKGKTIRTQVSNPFFQPIDASYLYSESTKTAFIEMAEASGHKILSNDELDVKNATTLGTGELIVDAMKRGAETIILGVGGSATNDCGIGMATALGYRFLDKNNNEVKPIGLHLSMINTIDDSNLHPKMEHVSFKVACDVSNPLYGKNGAAQVYAKQKGASPEEIVMLDKGLRDFSKVLDAHFKIDSQNTKGAGAAGGMGIGAYTFLNTELTPGIDLVKDIADFDNKIKGADWIITGEGSLDEQTLSGKAVIGVLNTARNNKIPVATFCGQVLLDDDTLVGLGIAFSDSIMNHAKSFDDAILNTRSYLKNISEQFCEYLG
ncbi:MAG: glycerate kinase [Flavobacteriaceae bacterium]|nr:glycerate kinase [Bacteroidia bacterium]NNL60618.1 glycerate kinase [Flavobacteriaceae bacterium]